MKPSSPRTDGRPTARLIRWLCLVTGAVAVPIAMTYLFQPGPARSAAVEFGVFLGFLAMALMAGQFATTGRFPRLARPIGQGTMMRIHRAVGIAAVALALLHPIVLFLADGRFLAFLDPRANLPRTLALVTVTFAAILLVITPLLRRRIGLSYEWWRLSHGALAAMVVFIGVVHMNMVGHHIAPIWKRAIWIAIAGSAIGLLIHSRLLRPLRLRRKPWRITEVRPEHERTWTLVLEPQGHEGMPFQTGQHVWLTIGDSPFSLQQHPFTIASSDANPRRIELTIKALGDFTSTIGEVKPGTCAFLEGPYGASWLTEEDSTPLVMIAGGIGITPFVSALRTLRDRGQRRPFILIHGSDTLEKATFHRELRELADALSGRLVTVLEHPPADTDPPWTGPTGTISRQLLQDTLGDEHLRHGRFILCGPAGMLDAVDRSLKSLGVAPQRIHVERFDMV